MDRFRRDELTFDVHDVGPPNGDPVILLHGFPETSRQWRLVAAQLGAHGCRVLVPDQRGYSPGARPRGIRAYRLSQLSADVEALADAAGLEDFHVVGHDWGGMVAWDLAANRGERIRSATVLSTPHPAALVGSLLHSDQLLRSAYVGLFCMPVVAEGVLGAAGGTPLRLALERSGLSRDDARSVADHAVASGLLPGALNWYRAAALGDARSIGTVDRPTLYVWSSGDVALGRHAANRTGHHVVGDYRYEVLEGVSHWLHHENPVRIAELVGEQVRAHP